MRVLHLLLAFLATVSLSAQSFQYPRYLEFIPGPVTPGTGPGTGTGPTVRVPHVGNEADFSFPAAQNFSVDFWFRPRSKATGFPILYKKKTAPDTTRGFAIYYNQTEQSLRVNLGNADTSIILDGPDIEVGKWIHIAVIINRGTGIASLFVNGQIEDAENIDGNLTSPTQLVLMGIGSTSTSYTSGGGSLAELRLWRSSLNPNEIRLLAYEQLNPVTPALGINSIGRLSGRLYQSRASSLVLRLRMTTSSPGAVPDSSAGANTGFMYQGNNGPLSSNTATFRRVNDTTTASYYPPPAPAIPRSTNTNNQGWSDPSSWFGPRPETYINPPIVLVPSGKVLKLTDDLPLALDIVVNSGGTLNDVSTGANQLVLFGGIRNNGTVNLGNTSTFLQGSGTLVFSGSSPIRLRNMEINLDNPTDVVRFDNQVEVINAGTVFLEVGRLETQNNLILKARASAPHFSHLVASGTTGNFAILGNIQMEGYLSNTNPGWRQMGFPLKNASLGSGNITGIPLLTTSYVANPGARNVYYYDAVRQGGSLVQNVQRAKGWTQATSTMTNNRAYTIFIDGASPLWPASTFPTITGTPDFANAGFILGYSLDPVYDTVGKTEGQKSQARGWNIVPNPYPASLSAVSLMTSLGSKLIYKAVHVWDHKVNQYRVIHQAGFGTAINYNGNAANTSGNLIPPFGAFWIKNDWDPSNQPLLPNITLNRGMLTGSEDVIMHRNEVPQHLPLTVWAEDSTADQVIFRFNPEAGTAFNPALDASKWHSGIDGVPSLFFVADEGMECTIKAREEGAQTVPLSLKVNTANTRTYTFSADLSYWERQPNPLLYDKALKKTHDLSVGPYTFTMQPGEAEDRFELRFEASSASSQSPSMPPLQAWASGGLLTLKSNGAQTVTATLLSVSGQVIGTFKPTDAGMQVQLPARGLYLVQWSTGADAGVLKVLY